MCLQCSISQYAQEAIKYFLVRIPSCTSINIRGKGTERLAHASALYKTPLRRVKKPDSIGGLFAEDIHGLSRKRLTIPAEVWREHAIDAAKRVLDCDILLACARCRGKVGFYSSLHS